MENKVQGRFTRFTAIILIICLLFAQVTATASAEDADVNLKVMLNANGGVLTGADNFTVSGAGDLSYPDLTQYGIPTKTGHTFIGWFKTEVGGTAIKEGDPLGTEDHTIYAHWTANKYKINFDGNGGSVSKSLMEVTYGDLCGVLATAKKTGYGLIGWYTGTGKLFTANTVYDTVGDTTLYAKWGKNYKIVFDGNKGKVSKKSKTVTKGLAYGSLPVPARKGYTFLGWYTKLQGGSKITETKIVGLTKNMRLYARWTLAKPKMNFDATGGKVSKKYKKVTYSKKYGKLPTPKRKGYYFRGWYTKKKGGSRITSNMVSKRAKDSTIYARWKAKKISVKFNPNGGKVKKTKKVVTFDKKYGSLPKPTRKGYKFQGWHSKKSGGTKLTKSSVVKYVSNKTLYARWGKISTLTFKYQNGKKGKKSKKIVYNEKYGSLPSTSRSGYTFKGWYTKKSGGTKVTSSRIVKTKKNITLYAQWESTMPIIKMLAPAGSKCRPGYKRSEFGGVTIHNTGNKSSTADALNHAKYLQGTGKNKQASWHYCVDETNITQSIPESEVAWHAGDGRNGYGNSRNISIEICMNEGGDILAATDKAAMLTAYILNKYGHTLAISKVNLYQHNFHSGKNCPEMIRKGIPYNWDTFVNKVNLFL